MRVRRRFGFFVMLLLSAVLSIAPAAHATFVPTGLWPSPTYQMKQAYGVATDASGNIFIADTVNNRVVKYGASGGMWAWGSLGSDARMFDHPHAIAVSPDGRYLYVADTGNNRIQKLTAEGAFVSAWGREGGPDAAGSGSKEFAAPKGICVDGAGYVYVADTGNERVQKFDKDGVFQGKWGSPGSEDGQFYEPVGIAASLDGKIYVADHDRTNNYVSCFDTTGQFIRRFGGVGRELWQPWGVAVDASGIVYVSSQDMLRYRITAFAPNGVALRSWGVSGAGDYDSIGNPELWQPAGLAILGTGSQSLLVCEPPKDRIREFALSGATRAIRGSWGVYWGRFDTVSGVAVDKLGNVAATSESPANSQFRMSHTIQKFTSSGSFIGVSPTMPPPQLADSANRYLNKATAVAFDSLGSIYVAEAGNHRIQKFRPQSRPKDPRLPANSVRNLASEDLVYETKWAEKGTGDGRLDSPGGVACANIDGAVRVFVSDTNNHRVAMFSGDGYSIGTWGVAGSKAGQLRRPTGIAVTPDGIVYVADTGNHRVQYFDVRGTYLGGWGSQGKPSEPSKFSRPGGVAVGPSGEVYVADTGNDRIKKFTYRGAPLGMWGSSGSDPGEFLGPRGIAVNSAGVIYVADSGNHRIQYFPPAAAVGAGVVITTGRSSSWVRYGMPVTVTASLTDTSGVVLAGRRMTVSTSYDGRTWSHAETTVSATGRYAYTLPLDRKTYFRWAFSGEETYSPGEGYVASTSQASLAVPSGPVKARKYTAATYEGVMKPRHAAGSAAVVLKAYRLERGRWVYRASGAAVLHNELGYSRYRGAVMFSSAGSWRVRAYHKDASHAATHSGYTYVTVK